MTDTDQQIAVIPGDGSKPLGVLMVLMPEADTDGVYTVHVEEEMVLAWARNIEDYHTVRTLACDAVVKQMTPERVDSLHRQVMEILDAGGDPVVLFPAAWVADESQRALFSEGALLLGWPVRVAAVDELMVVTDVQDHVTGVPTIRKISKEKT